MLALLLLQRLQELLQNYADVGGHPTPNSRRGKRTVRHFLAFAAPRARAALVNLRRGVTIPTTRIEVLRVSFPQPRTRRHRLVLVDRSLRVVPDVLSHVVLQLGMELVQNSRSKS